MTFDFCFHYKCSIVEYKLFTVIYQNKSVLKIVNYYFDITYCIKYIVCALALNQLPYVAPHEGRNMTEYDGVY
jgi:hypothetical protein